MMGGSQSTWRELTDARGEHANSTQKEPTWDLNQEPSYCEATVLTTTIQHSIVMLLFRWFIAIAKVCKNGFIWQIENLLSLITTDQLEPGQVFNWCQSLLLLQVLWLPASTAVSSAKRGSGGKAEAQQRGRAL